MTHSKQQVPTGAPLRANAERTRVAASCALERRFRRLSHRPGGGRNLPCGVSGCGHVDRPHTVRFPHLESRAARQAGAGQSSDEPATSVGIGQRVDKTVDFAPVKKWHLLHRWSIPYQMLLLWWRLTGSARSEWVRHSEGPVDGFGSKSDEQVAQIQTVAPSAR